MAKHAFSPAASALALLPLEGLPGPDTEEQLAQILTMQVRLAAGRTQPAGQEVDDLLTEGFLCARRALASYDPELGVPFPAYYRIVLRRRFIDLSRRKRPQTNADLEAAMMRQTERADRTEQFRLEVRDTLSRFLDDDHLSEKKREAFRLFHVEGWKLSRLSRHFGKCVVTVRRWVREAESRFKRLWLQGENAA